MITVISSINFVAAEPLKWYILSDNATNLDKSQHPPGEDQAHGAIQHSLQDQWMASQWEPRHAHSQSCQHCLPSKQLVQIKICFEIVLIERLCVTVGKKSLNKKQKRTHHVNYWCFFVPIQSYYLSGCLIFSLYQVENREILKTASKL